MNKQFILCFLSAFIVLSCSREKRVVEASYPDGSPKRVCVYRVSGENKELIKETTYYPGKKMQMEGTYVNGKRDGTWTYWYQNGRVWSEGLFKDGKCEGLRTTYFENGKIRYKGLYKDDTRVGKWQFYDEKGKLLQEVDFSAPAKAGK